MAAIANFATSDYSAGAETSVTMSALNGAAGDGSLASWALVNGSPRFTQQMVTMLARANKARNARHLEIRGVVPWVRQSTDTGLFQLVSKATFFTTIVLPDSAPQWVHDNCVHLAGASLMNGGQFSQIRTGYAPG